MHLIAPLLDCLIVLRYQKMFNTTELNKLKKLLIRFSLLKFGPSVPSFVIAFFVRSSSTGLNCYFDLSLDYMTGPVNSSSINYVTHGN